MKKNSNIFSTKGKYSVKIFDGMNLVCGYDKFTSAEEARDSAKRIIESQKKICGESMTAYAMVFDSKRMLYYFD